MKETKGKSKPAERSANPDDGEAIWKDERFEHLVNDPRFKGIPKKEKKIKIDKRFQSMFNDPKFEVKYSYDKYGRKVKKSSANDLKKFYEIKSDEEEDEEGAPESEEEEAEKDDTQADGDEDNDALDGITVDIPGKLKKRLRDLDTDYARGEGYILTDSSSDDESGDEEDDEAPELFIDHVWGELDRDAPMTEESSRRLAVCNMDWDKMRAEDIMVLCNSFLPPNSAILRVAIYPSEYGKERMKEEEERGPQELVAKSKGPTADDDDGDSSGIEDLLEDEDDEDENGEKKSKRKQLNEEEREGDGFFMEKLRQYQLNRLKYYYAVIECDSISTADKLYIECDGLEYESSATKLDLRFIPDDMEFEDEPREECTEMPDLTQYAPRMFQTGALQNAKVDLTWDETAEDRKEFAEKLKDGKLNTISDAELKKYLACSSDEDDEADRPKPKLRTKIQVASGESSSEGEDDDPSESVNKYRNLLAEIKSEEEKKKNRNIEMEFSWDVKAQNKLESNDKDENVASAALTPFEKLIEKQKKKRELRRNKKNKNAAKDEMLGDSDSDVPDGIDMNDPYFAEEFATGDFAPKKTVSKAKEAKEQRKEEEEEQKKQQAELALLLDDDDKSKSHFSLKKIQKSEADEQTTSKRKRKRLLKKSKEEILEKKSKTAEADGFIMDLNDDRFGAMYSSHLYNIDPTDPNFKKTKVMETIITEKLSRKKVVEEDVQPVKGKRSSEQIQNDLLVNKLKRKLK